MSTPAGDDLLGNANIRINADTDPAIRALGRLSRDAQGRIRDIRGRFVSEADLIRLGLTNAAGGGDRFSLSLRGIAGAAGTAAGILGRVGIGVAAIGAAAGTAAPLLAGIVTTLESIAPAGAVAVTGMLAIQQASAAIKLGMIGVEDAVTAAFDTSKEGAKQFDEALKKLAPNARAFAVQVRELAPAFKEFQQSVQNELFRNTADTLQLLSTSVLPILNTNLQSTAATLNEMGVSAALAADQLAADGTLGKAMDGANTGLGNLAQIPAQLVTALGQLAAAGAPAFDRLTAAAARAATGISERLGNAFESGALERAIDTAIGVLGDLAEVGGNVFAILGNVMAPAQQAGGGLVGVLVQITGALRDATATQGFQEAMGAIGSVMGTLAGTVGPLLGQALAALGPVFTALGPPLEVLITALGDGLSQVITALGPVLTAAATAVGALVRAVSPMLPVIGQLVASLLPAVTPLFDALTTVFVALQPVISRIATTLQQTLAPVMAGLSAIIAPLANLIATQLVMWIGVFGDLLTQLQPSLISVGTSLGQLLSAVGPLVDAWGRLSTQILAAVLPALTPLIRLAGLAAAIFADRFASAVTAVIPHLIRLAAFLNAAADRMQPLVDASQDAARLVIAAFQFLYDTLVGNSIIPDLIDTAVKFFASLPGRAASALASLAGAIGSKASQAAARLLSVIRNALSEAVTLLKGLPGRARSALSSLGGTLASVATSALNRFRSAVSSGASSAVGVARTIPGRIRGALGSVGSILYSAGRSIIQGLINGITSLAGGVTSAVSGVLSDARALLPFSPAKEGPFSGRGWTLFSGRAISESLARGISDRERLVQRAARMVAESAQGAVSMPLRMAPVRDATFDARIASQVGAVRSTAVGQGVAPVSITLRLTNQGVIGSRMELEDWLARALDTLGRTGRLTRALRSA